MNKFRTIFLSPEGQICQVTYLNKDNYFKHAYSIMGVELLDVVTLKLEDRLFTVLCDDEGLLKNKVYYSIFDEKRPLIAGNVIIMHESPVDEDGKSILEDLTDEEIKCLQRNLVNVTNNSTGETNLAIANMDYPL